ncbi:hypothetical protein Pla110_07340 [Polystyrenella longa]|uniref:DUF3592 domain-containing protein n=1 Tax=Polystyrenella longa TaxID=2528007 RepID=A0A518CIJ0_9PLAN|nr:DUF3592 domain-containing protein [Polystyrenella longa]QDU79030.1 hypothetical protein Pla110_07340 [Polystyrenella longa]
MSEEAKQMMADARNRFLVMYLGLFLLVGGTGGYLIFGSYIRSWSYEPVPGVITKSSLESCGMDGFAEEIRFSYQVDGKEYYQGRLREDFGKFCDKKQAIQELLDEYPVGSNVEAWYDPDQPSHAVIDRSMGQIQWVMGCVLIGFSVILLIAWLMQYSNLKRQAVSQDTT